jgi:histidinol phosphatase-like enzyme (inositol monophosphatase family)
MKIVDSAAWLDVAHQLADASGPVILPLFRRRMKIENKAGPGAFDPVTAADKAAEKAIRKIISARFPDHAVIGEEFADTHPTQPQPLTWIIDPIDGTRAFVSGLPLWGTLIGLMNGPVPVVGLMDQPYTRERFWGTKKGAFSRDAVGKVRRIRTRRCTGLSDAVLMSTAPELFQPGAERRRFESVSKSVRMTRYGGDCYAYCMLAAGHIDLVVEAGLKIFDIVPLIPIIEAAGGVVSDWNGGPATSGGRVIAAGDALVHAAALEFLRDTRKAAAAQTT